MVRFEVRVPGIPITQGSMKPITIRGKTVLIHDKSPELNGWRDGIGLLTRSAMARSHSSLIPKGEPVRLTLSFYLPQPKTNSSMFPVYKNDIDKLTRSVLDALTGIAYVDDGQVTQLFATKSWADAESSSGLYLVVRSA